MDLKGNKLCFLIPAYNAARYIKKSLESVLSQSHRELEVIVINDGSVDDTAAIVSAMAEKDSRLRLLTVENGGPAMARNRGLDAMSEDVDYVMFLDADDLLLPGAVEYALSAAEKGAELVMMGFTIKNADGSSRDYFEPEQWIEPSGLGEALPRLYMANMLNQVWAKLISARLIREHHLRFPDYRWGEDRLFIFDCLERIKLAAVLPGCYYLYIMHPGESLITRFYDKKAEVCRLADSRVAELCARFGTKDDAPCRYMFVKSIFSCLTNLYSPSCALSHGEKRAYMKEILADEQFRRRSRGAFGGLPLKLMCAVMRTGLVELNLLMFRAVALVGKTAPRLFTALKHRK